MIVINGYETVGSTISKMSLSIYAIISARPWFEIRKCVFNQCAAPATVLARCFVTRKSCFFSMIIAFEINHESARGQITKWVKSLITDISSFSDFSLTVPRWIVENDLLIEPWLGRLRDCGPGRKLQCLVTLKLVSIIFSPFFARWVGLKIH